LLQPKGLIIGAIVLLGAITLADAPFTSPKLPAPEQSQVNIGVDQDRIVKRETPAPGAMAPSAARLPAVWPPIAAQTTPSEPEIVENAAPPLADRMSFSTLISKTVFAPPRHFGPHPGELPYRTFEFSARDEGRAELGIDGTMARGAFSSRRLTILQLGDSHTAADFFTGRVRERLQEAYGTGGAGYIVPGVPHPGVRSAMFKDEASDGWNYEALQKSAENSRFFLSGFNAVARHAGAVINLTARDALGYDGLKVAFLKQPGGGHAQVLIDGALSGEIDLDGASDQRAILSARAPGASTHAIREIAVRSTSDAPVTVTGIHVERDGDGVSYLSLGFPGATVQVLEKLAVANLSDDMRRIAPDIIVLAFGTNEGFNDALDIGAYSAEYQRVIAKLKFLQPDARIVLIGPPDGARLPGAAHPCSGGATGHDCGETATRSIEVSGASHCRFETPPKLAQVRDAQRAIAEKAGAMFWDWSSIMPGPCGAQTWAAATPPLMAHDYVHMTLDGYRLSADKFADFLIPLIDDRQSLKHVVSYN
jgi:lysophospholipase L1-like esterase